MKNLSILQIAFTFVGCFIGVGFVSGKEQWMFLGSFGVPGFVGLLIAELIFLAFGIMLLRLAKMSGIEEMDKIIIRWNIPWLRNTLAVVECVYLFGAVTIMVAAAGALVDQLAGFPAWIANLIMSVLLVFVAIAGLKGMVSAFAIYVPILIVASIGVAISAFFHYGIDSIEFIPSDNGNPLLPHWIIGALTYAAYNMFAAIGMLTPLGRYIEKKRTVVTSISIGVLIMLIMSSSILCAIAASNGAGDTSLPMIELASGINSTLGYVYGAVLLLGMFGGALSCFVALETYIKIKFEKIAKHRIWVIIILVALAFIASLTGFDNLISTIYPVFGYLTIALFVCIVVNYFHYARKEKRGELDTPENQK